MILWCLHRSFNILKTKDCRLNSGVCDHNTSCCSTVNGTTNVLLLVTFATTVAIEMIANKLFDKYIEKMEAKVRNHL